MFRKSRVLLLDCDGVISVLPGVFSLEEGDIDIERYIHKIPNPVEPVVVEPKTVEPETVEPETVEPETVEPETEPKTVEPKTVEPKTVEPEPVEPKTVEPKTVEHLLPPPDLLTLFTQGK